MWRAGMPHGCGGSFAVVTWMWRVAHGTRVASPQAFVDSGSSNAGMRGRLTRRRSGRRKAKAAGATAASFTLEIWRPVSWPRRRGRRCDNRSLLNNDFWRRRWRPADSIAGHPARADRAAKEPARMAMLRGVSQNDGFLLSSRSARIGSSFSSSRRSSNKIVVSTLQSHRSSRLGACA
jgi:hypothetical protein